MGGANIICSDKTGIKVFRKSFCLTFLKLDMIYIETDKP